ncbi:hypothetical protein PHYSODRAFT_334561, partial [Phytophthora sojae]
MDEEYGDYLEEKAPAPAVVTPETPEDAVMSAGRSGGSRSLARSLASELEDDTPPVSRNLADELDDVDDPEPAYDDMEEFEDRADDSRSPVPTTQVTEQTSGNRPPMNGDTPAANKVLGRCFEAMRASEWGRLFEPRMIRQAVWADLSHELARPVNAVAVEQVAKDTVTFLKALCLRPTLAPSPSTLESFLPAEARAELWQWKKKLYTAFGVTPFSLEQPKAARTNKGSADPARVPLPRTPKKTERSNSAQAATRGVFSASGERSPYFQDSHMVTPPATTRTDRVARGAEDSKLTRSSLRSTGRSSSRKSRYADDSSDDDDDFTGDGGAQMDEYLRQIREVSDAETVNPTPRLEIPTFSGARNRSENSMQWLRAFVYEMKGTHAPPNEWCMPFELRLRDGAVHWHRQLTKKTKRTWTLLSEAFIRYYCSQFSQSAETRYYSAKRDDKEHVCDYLNRLNGYARNAGVQFVNGGRKAKDHVKRFLGTCGDRKLERRLAPLRIKDIHELEEMIIEMLKVEERQSSRESSQSRSKAREPSRRRDDTRMTRVAEMTGTAKTPETDTAAMTRELATAVGIDANEIMSVLQGRDARSTSTGRDSARQQFNDDSDAASDQGSDDSWYSEEGRHDGYSSDDSDHYVAAANESERCAAADGTVAGNPVGTTGTSAEAVTTIDNASTVLARPVAFFPTRPTSATGAASYASKYTTQAGSPPTETGLVPIGLPQLAEPVVEAECIYAFVGKREWPDEGRGTWVNATEFEKERGEGLGGGDLSEKSDDEVIEDTTEDWMTSAVQEASRRRLDVEDAGERRVNDSRTRILLDSGANITLGWERVYVFEMWIIDHNAGVNVVLGTDFMIPADIRLDLFNAAAKLPDEVMIPLIKTQNMVDEAEGVHVNGGPVDVLQIPGREWKEFRMQRKRPSPTTHVPWIRWTDKLIPTVKRFHKGRPQRIRLTNIDTRLTICSAHTTIVVWVPIGSLPKSEGYVRLDSDKYREWQVLIYEAARDKTLLKWEAELYAQWLAAQPSAVDRPEYPTPKGLLRQPPEDSQDEHSSESSDSDGGKDSDGLPCKQLPWRRLSALLSSGTGLDEPTESKSAEDEVPTTQSCSNSDIEAGLTRLEQTFMCVLRVLSTEGTETANDDAADSFEHLAAGIGLEDYAHGLAFPPDLSEAATTTLDYDADN